MLKEATAYLEGHRRRTTDALKAYQRGIDNGLSPRELSTLKIRYEGLLKEWNQAIAQVKLDTQELQFRVRQS